MEPRTAAGHPNIVDMKVALKSAALLLAGIAVVAQEQDTVIKVDVSLVNLLASVRAKNGALINTLEQKDFKIFEDGKEQQIRNFARETDLPLTIGLLVDTSGSQARLIEDERRAAYLFFQKVLRQKDVAFLMQFGPEAELLQDSTNSTRALQRGLDQLRLTGSMGGIGPGPVPTRRNAAGTVLFDAVYLAAEEKLKREVGRKAIVLITDGVDTGSKVSRDKAIESAQKADCMIYSIYYVDRAAYGFGTFGSPGGGESDLRRMSSETGGQLFRVDGKNTLLDIFAQIQEEMRSQYSIAYAPPNPQRDGTYHKIELRAVNKDHKVQARKGYYAIEPEN